MSYPTPATLNAAMEFDACYRVAADGSVTYFPNAPYLELTDGELSAPDGWELMDGYTGQHSYNGPIMHASEFIGGRMARDILDTPGLYVVMANYPTGHADVDGCDAWDGDGDDGECLCTQDPDGWAVAFLADDCDGCPPDAPAHSPGEHGCLFA